MIKTNPLFLTEEEILQQKGNYNRFEEVIDKMMMDEVVGLDEALKRQIQEIPRNKQRISILSILDKDRKLFMKLFEKVKDAKDNPGKVEYITDVVEMMREYVKVGEVEKKKFGEVMTPIELVEEMLDTLPEDVWSNPYLKWLDPANGSGTFPSVVVKRLMEGLVEFEPNEEKRYRHIMENMIYVCELQPKNMFLYLCAFDIEDKYKLNIFTGSFLDKEFDFHMKNIWKVDKFDIVIGNPPYNNGIDLNFIEKLYPICDKLLFVHPSTWLLDEKHRQKQFIKTKNLISHDLESIKIFNGNPIFGIALFVPCVITYINKQKDDDKIKCIDLINDINLEYDDIYQINKYSNVDEYISIKGKILNNINENVWQNRNKEGNYYVNTAQIRGHVYVASNLSRTNIMLQDDFYTIVTKDLKVSKNKNKHLFFGFEFENEANNFLNYLKTNFTRFCLSIYKNNANLHRGELKFVPWLDFSQEWTDEKLYKHFNLTEKEIEFIESVIPKYY